MYRQDWFTQFQHTLSSFGLNTVGVLDRATYNQLAPEGSRCEDIFPPTGTVLVVGSGGTHFWDQFVEHLRLHPHHLTEQPHPLDHFLELSLHLHQPVIQAGGDTRVIPITHNTPIFLDVRKLALASGQGTLSPVGLLLHPEFGLWWALRVVIFTEVEVPPSLPLPSSPCVPCPAPCISACPAGAVQSSGFVFDRCQLQHQQSQTCTYTCHARNACIVAPQHTYRELQSLYHNARGPGRLALRQALNIKGDRFEGQGPWT